jgi:predicted SprT family Zn-dependent metalloprotease
MDLYLNDLLGLFNPKAKVIYVGSFMEQCKFNSIVAHEITHYFQVLEEGIIDTQSTGFEYIHLFREMQAGNIMDMYMKAFCVSPDSDGEMASNH